MSIDALRHAVTRPIARHIYRRRFPTHEQHARAGLDLDIFCPCPGCCMYRLDLAFFRGRQWPLRQLVEDW
jgi:hypothetical protein